MEYYYRNINTINNIVLDEKKVEIYKILSNGKVYHCDKVWGEIVWLKSCRSAENIRCNFTQTDKKTINRLAENFELY